MRLFFGLETVAPWPEELPPGRHLSPEARHITLAFLGEVDEKKLLSQIQEIPLPTRLIGWQGQFTKVAFYPSRKPHVAAWNMKWDPESQGIVDYQKELASWLKDRGFKLEEKHPFNPHVTLCRSPFNQREWEKAFHPLPYYTGALNLYQSLGNSRYKAIWSHPFQPPFIEIEHTADIAFQIFAEREEQLFQHARVALAFKVPNLINEPLPPFAVDSMEKIVKGLNWHIAQLDQKEPIPFKAVSYHGEIEKKGPFYTWEMIVDV